MENLLEGHNWRHLDNRWMDISRYFLRKLDAMLCELLSSLAG
jgi:hypothetical protein